MLDDRSLIPKASISSEKSELSPGLNESFDDDSCSESSTSENKDEMDLIQIADVEKYVKRRLSKGNAEENDQNLYELSPKMNKLLGKFFSDAHAERNRENGPENRENEITLIEHPSLTGENSEKRDSKKGKNLTKNSATMKKQMKLGNKTNQSQMVRRNSVSIFSEFQKTFNFNKI